MPVPLPGIFLTWLRSSEAVTRQRMPESVVT